MKRLTSAIAIAGLLTTVTSAMAGQAESSAAASSNGWGPGTATATAGYHGGGVGFAQTDTRSGNVNLARGLSFGFDGQGLSLSSSYAVAPQLGPALAGTFNLAIGTDGSVSHSTGRTVALGDSSRQAQAGGFASPGYAGRPALAGATASGRTGQRGRVMAGTRSQSYRPGVLTRSTPRLLRRTR